MSQHVWIVPDKDPYLWLCGEEGGKKNSLLKEKEAFL